MLQKALLHLDIMMLFNNGDILQLSRLSKRQKISLSAAKCGKNIRFKESEENGNA